MAVKAGIISLTCQCTLSKNVLKETGLVKIPLPLFKSIVCEIFVLEQDTHWMANHLDEGEVGLHVPIHPSTPKLSSRLPTEIYQSLAM